MSERFIISDTHFSHRGIVTFTTKNGKPERPWDTIEEMDEALVKNWNSVVGPKDKVYHLGDFCINRSALPICARLNGIKRLIKGNHDVLRMEEYAPYFKDVHGSYPLNEFILTHIPLHPQAVAERWKGNFHGHLHSERVMKEPDEYSFDIGGTTIIENVIDPLYLCLSAEQVNYTPISYEDAVKRWEEQQ